MRRSGALTAATCGRRCESDSLSHLYTLVVKPDGTYTVSIDMKEALRIIAEDKSRALQHAS